MSFNENGIIPIAQEINNVCGNVLIKETSFAIVGNVRWFNLYGKLHEDFSKISQIIELHMILNFYFLTFTPHNKTMYMNTYRQEIETIQMSTDKKVMIYM